MSGVVSPAAISRTCETNEGATKRCDWPGPVWLSGRATRTCMSYCLAKPRAATSAAAFEMPYRPTGPSGESSVTRCSLFEKVYTCDEDATSVVQSGACARMASSRLTVPAMLTSSICPAACAASGTNAIAPRCTTASGRAVRTTSATVSASRRSPGTVARASAGGSESARSKATTS